MYTLYQYQSTIDDRISDLIASFDLENEICDEIDEIDEIDEVDEIDD